MASSSSSESSFSLQLLLFFLPRTLLQLLQLSLHKWQLSTFTSPQLRTQPRPARSKPPSRLSLVHPSSPGLSSLLCPSWTSPSPPPTPHTSPGAPFPWPSAKPSSSRLSTTSSRSPLNSQRRLRCRWAGQRCSLRSSTHKLTEVRTQADQVRQGRDQWVRGARAVARWRGGEGAGGRERGRGQARRAQAGYPACTGGSFTACRSVERVSSSLLPKQPRLLTKPPQFPCAFFGMAEGGKALTTSRSDPGERTHPVAVGGQLGPPQAFASEIGRAHV